MDMTSNHSKIMALFPTDEAYQMYCKHMDRVLIHDEYKFYCISCEYELETCTCCDMSGNTRCNMCFDYPNRCMCYEHICKYCNEIIMKCDCDF